jgi:DNA polymerase-3 subunit gamma/tau
MVYEPLHHKYRPQTFGDLVGQEAITTTLSNALKRNRIAPAYLFTGPRGTGKTSSARILAKSLNCLKSEQPTPYPCGECEVCRAIARGSALDVIEIDAASNTGVDNIRELIERAQFAPVQCRYKVYVVDECHMLSTAAFNALLKTLEEPPERVIFVLATTDPQRVLPTIISRCQRFDYRRIPLDAMVSHLRTIADKEAIEIDPEALTLVAQIANGGLRDAESLLDQLSLLEGIVNPTKVWELVGAVPEQDLLTLICSLRSQETEAILDKSRHLMNRGREPLVILQNLANFYLNLLIAKTAPQRSDLVAVTAPTWQALCLEAQQWSIARILAGQQHLKESELQIKNTTQPRLWLEVTLLGLLTVPSNPNPAPTPTSSNPAPVPTSTSSNPAPAPTSTPSNPAPPPTPTPGVEGDTIWEKILGHIQQMTTRSILRQHGTLVSLQDTVAYISLSSEALLKLVQPQLSVVEAAFASVCQHPVKVHLKLGEAPTTPPTEKPSPSPLPSPPPELEKPEVKPLPPINTEKKAPPPPPIAPPVPSINLDTDVQKAAANLAKYFDGEIVNLDYSPDPEPDDSPKVIILGRPKLEDVMDDDDLPF